MIGSAKGKWVAAIAVLVVVCVLGELIYWEMVAIVPGRRIGNLRTNSSEASSGSRGTIDYVVFDGTVIVVSTKDPKYRLKWRRVVGTSIQKVLNMYPSLKEDLSGSRKLGGERFSSPDGLEVVVVGGLVEEVSVFLVH